MLESNTDRMYFVIGSIIVAALLIVAAKTIFGVTLFGPTGQLSGLISDIVTNAKGAITNIK